MDEYDIERKENEDPQAEEEMPQQIESEFEEKEEKKSIRFNDLPEEKPERGVNVPGSVLILFLVGSLLLSVLSSYVTAKIVSGSAKTTVVEYQAVENSNQTVIQKPDYTELVEQVKDCVVEVYTEQVSYGSFFGNYVTEGAGSGVIMSSDGYIVTNNHVISAATSINVTLSDGQKYEASLVATDAFTDIAVIKIEATGLKTAVMGDSDGLQVGQYCMAIGNPLGTLGGTVTTGIVSALSREVTVEGIPMTLMQIDAAISPGNSGGGLFNTNGQLIGIVNAKSSSENSEGIGFAIPVNKVRDIAQQLIENGYVTGRAQLGIKCISIESVQQAWKYGVNSYGVLVDEVTDENTAAAGLQKGDLIVGINNTTINSLISLQVALYSYNAGDVVKLHVIRDHAEIVLDVTLQQKKQ